MDGHESADVVPAALEPAAPVSSGGLPAVGAVTGLIGALGNHNVASMEAAGEQRPAFTPSPPADNELGRALADTLQHRPMSVSRIPSISMPKVPSGGGSQPTTTPSNAPGPAPAPAPSQGRAGGIAGGVMEAVKRMMEQQAKARAELEAEIAEIEPTVAMYGAQVIPGLAAGVAGATAHMAPGLLGGNLRALATGIVGAKVSPDSESVKLAVMDQLRTAVATLESMDEPVEKTVEDTKASATGGVESIDAAIAAGQQTDAPPEGGGAATPRANASQLASLNAAKAQLETINQLTASTDAASVASLATFTNATVGSLAALGAGAHETMKPAIEAARRKAIGAARQMEAMGRSKEQNYAVVAGALGTAMGQAVVVQTLTMVHLENQKKKLAAMPKPEPPPDQPPAQP
jgi:hypothetical protein